MKKLKPELIHRILHSKKFLRWTPILYKRSATRFVDSPASEDHFSPKDLAIKWGLSVDTIREMFQNEPDVLIVVRPATRHKRRYRTFRIPESVAVRVHNRLTAKPC